MREGGLVRARTVIEEEITILGPGDVYKSLACRESGQGLQQQLFHPLGAKGPEYLRPAKPYCHLHLKTEGLN